MKLNDVMEAFAKENHVPILIKDGLEFILRYIQENPIENILEIGTAIGYSAINMAKIRKTIQIDTLEINEDWYKQACMNVQNSGLENQIHLYLGDALCHNTAKKYDLIFVDAAKGQYRKYMEHFKENLTSEGIYIFDNLNFHGMVDKPSLTRSRRTRSLVLKIERFRNWILHESAFETQFYSEVGDGIAVVSVKKDWDMIE